MRCKFSQHGIESLNPKNPNRMGEGRLGNIYAIVRWDGQKCESRYHKSFIDFEQVCEIDLSRAPVLRQLLGLEI